MMLVHSRSEHGGLMECGIEIEQDRNLASMEIDRDLLSILISMM